jgi:hypothetical protein
MSEWKLCKGCRHLAFHWCHVHDDWHTVTDQITGLKYRKNFTRNRGKEMRGEDGLCGPEAKLYEHKFLKRLWLRMTRHD